jgi:uncharacterized protein YbcV (DUF1398 family)
MFTIDQITEAHDKVRSGADFPKYIQELISMNIASYETYVSDGHTEYIGKDNSRLLSEARYPAIEVAPVGDAQKFGHYLRIHQQGQTSYPVFCNHSAETGVEKWTVDINSMTCTYYDKKGNQLLVEEIPDDL